ncbi:c-type cytochrome [bacterium]|nr:c-type cytochrome [bacterium]
MTKERPTAGGANSWLAIYLIFVIGPLSLLLLSACASDPRPQPIDALPPEHLTAAQTSTNALVQSCLICHSTREMQRGPIIDGMPQWYLAQELHKFFTGVRGRNPTNRSEYLMGSGISLIKSKADIEEAARVFSQRPVQKPLKAIRGDDVRGQAIFTYCATCHGVNGHGREEIKAPPLVIQEDWYLYDQLVRFKTGLRGAEPTDPEGWLMHQVTQSLNTQDFRDVVSYVNDELRGRPPAPPDAQVPLYE